MNKLLLSSINVSILLLIRTFTSLNVYISFRYRIYSISKLYSIIEDGVSFSPGELSLSCNPSYLGRQELWDGWVTWGMDNRWGARHEECTTGGMNNMRNARHDRGRTWGMHDRWGAGHKECNPWGIHDIRNARQERCMTWGMHDRRDAWHEEFTMEWCRTWGMHDRWGLGHEECTTGGIHDMRNACMTGEVQDMRNAWPEGWRIWVKLQMSMLRFSCFYPEK